MVTITDMTVKNHPCSFPRKALTLTCFLIREMEPRGPTSQGAGEGPMDYSMESTQLEVPCVGVVAMSGGHC